MSRLQSDFMLTAHKFMRIPMHHLFREVTREEYFLLEVIGRAGTENCKGRGIYVYELASRMEVSAPAVSRMLKGLEGRGFIIRRADERNRRNTCVFLTQKGQNIKEQLAGKLENLADRIIARMGVEDMGTLLMLWNKLADVLETELGDFK